MSQQAAASPGKKAVCTTSDHVQIAVDVDTLRLSHTFYNMYKDLDLGGDADLEFPMPNVEARVFTKIVEWCTEHKGQPDPVVEQDEDTRERKWFVLTDYEKDFLSVPMDELQELIGAANYLDIKSLYYYGCQTIAERIKSMTPDEIRALFGCEDDLTEEEKEEVRRQNPWCTY